MQSGISLPVKKPKLREVVSLPRSHSKGRDRDQPASKPLIFTPDLRMKEALYTSHGSMEPLCTSMKEEAWARSSSVFSGRGKE